MNIKEVTEYLEQRGIKATPNRVLVLHELSEATAPVSLADLEVSLGTVDRASIFRVLELFVKNDILHVISDGSRSAKYEMCQADHHSIADEHVHFFCENCERLICLEDTPIPQVPLPDGFTPKSATFIIKGTCPDCRKTI